MSIDNFLLEKQQNMWSQVCDVEPAQNCPCTQKLRTQFRGLYTHITCAGVWPCLSVQKPEKKPKLKFFGSGRVLLYKISDFSCNAYKEPKNSGRV